MKTYVVTLEDHDDVISARDKISWSKAKRVLLVWPRRGKVLERRVDLLMLQRYAQSLGAQLAVVSASGLVKSHARDLGVPIFNSAAAAQDVPWRRTRRSGRLRLRLVRTRRPARSAQDLRERLNELRERKALPLAARLGIFAAAVAAAAAMALLLLPGAEIRISPVPVAQQLAVPVWVGTEGTGPTPAGQIPAQAITVTVEGRAQSPSTGQLRVPDQAASGTVEVTNLTNAPVEIPAGSIVLASGNPAARYTTLRYARVPAGPQEKVSIPVRAEQPGQAGNLAAGRIDALEGALGLRAAVTNPASISGGRDRISPAPNPADFRALHAALLEELQANAAREIEDLVGEDRTLLPGTFQMLTVLEETRQPEENQPGEQLHLSMRVEYQALAARSEDLRVVAESALDANVKVGYQPVPGSLRFTFSEEPEAAPGRPEELRWELRVERQLTPEIPTQDLVQDLRGQEVDSARGMLRSRLALTQAPEIRMFPTWWPRLPFLPLRIVVVQV